MPIARDLREKKSDDTNRSHNEGEHTSRLYVFIKRSIDILLSGALIVLCIPVLLLIALVIKFDSRDPIFWSQVRVGKDGKHFRLLKFRTMVASDVPQSSYLQDLVKDAGKSTDHSDRVFKLIGDPRITRVGRFLRKYALDELPALLNVLRGDMSLVGPRALHPYEVEFFRLDQTNRFRVKPGITGIWQVSGQTQDFKEMVKMDIDYASRQSLVLDLSILLRTIPAAFSGKSTH